MRSILQRKIQISFKWTAIIAYSILIIPILIFYIGWLKPYWAALFSIILLYGAYWIIKKDYWNNNDHIEVPLTILIVAGIVFTLWVLISGNCYFSVGNVDTLWRSTTMADLVNYDWPVYYPEKNVYLCYYFVFWMVPALFGKIFGGMAAAYTALFCWFVLILMTAFLLIAHYFKDYKKGTFKLILVFMIMWSGVNILGVFLMNRFGLPAPLLSWGNNEGYCDHLQIDGCFFNFHYKCNEDFITNNYNQIPVWLAVPLMLQNRRIRNYAFIGLLVFPFSPWCTVGISLLMAVDAVHFMINKKSVQAFIKEVLSIPNLCAILSVAVIFIPFYGCQDRFGSGEYGYGIFPIGAMTAQIWQGVLIFWLCEFGLYYIFTWKKYEKDRLYRSMLFFLMFIPFFYIGPKNGRDFCMNVSLPLLYLLMIYVIGYVKDHILEGKDFNSRKCGMNNCFLIAALFLSFTSPILNWMNKINMMNTAQSISLQERSISTFADILGYEGAFIPTISSNVEESIFLKLFVKRAADEDYQWLPISDDLSEIRDIQDINEYFDYLSGKDCTVFIAIQDIPGFNLTQEMLDRMKQIGFSDDLDILCQKEYHSFIGIADNGRTIVEHIGGDEHITYYNDGKNGGDHVWMESGTWEHGNCSAINIDSGHYSAHGRGLNIVVKDNRADRIIDSVAFDTHTEGIPCTRKAQ